MWFWFTRIKFRLLDIIFWRRYPVAHYQAARESVGWLHQETVDTGSRNGVLRIGRCMPTYFSYTNSLGKRSFCLDLEWPPCLISNSRWVSHSAKRKTVDVFHTIINYSVLPDLTAPGRLNAGKLQNTLTELSYTRKTAQDFSQKPYNIYS